MSSNLKADYTVALKISAEQINLITKKSVSAIMNIKVAYF